MTTDHKRDKGEVLAGQWLHGVRCHGCGAPIPIFHHPSEGGSGFHGIDPVATQCPSCGQEASYPPDEFISMRAVQG